MSILFPIPTQVKPARPFGAGILPARPERFEPTPEDRRWWAEESDRLERARENAHYDRLAADALAADRLERGLCF